jgi:hypothetical protein
LLFAVLALGAAVVTALVWGTATGHETIALAAWGALAASALAANARIVVRAVTRPRDSGR